MVTNPPKRQAPKPQRSAIRWPLDSDPSIHWHRATSYLPCSSAGNDCKYIHTAPNTSSIIQPKYFHDVASLSWWLA